MFSELFTKIGTFGEHHQTFIAILVTFCLICIAWAIEKIFEEYIFPHKPLYGYLGVLGLGLFILWLTKHVILHVV